MKERFSLTKSILDEQNEKWLSAFKEALNDVENAKDAFYPVIVIASAYDAIKFWIRSDRLFEKKSDELFMHNFIFVNKNDSNWERYILVIFRFKTLSEYEKECIAEHIKDNLNMDDFELEKVVLKGEKNE